DPLQCIASRYALQAQIYAGINGSLDRPALAAATVEAGLAGFAAAAESPYASDPRLQHLRYPEFVADPVGAIRGLYERGGLECEDGFATAMRAWSAANPSNRYGRFTYSVDALGVDVAALDRQLDGYRERFGVPREPAREG